MRTYFGRAMSLGLIVLLSVALSACAGSTNTNSSNTSASGGHDDLVADEASPAQRVLNAVYSSVVNIDVKATVGGQTGEGVGSGIIYTADGYIMTNDHVVTLDGNVTSGQIITVTFSSGETAPATLVGRDPPKDLAAIKVERMGLVPVNFAGPNDIQLAEWAIVIGSPLDFRNSVTLGIVSGLNRTLDFGGGQALSPV